MSTDYSEYFTDSSVPDTDELLYNYVQIEEEIAQFLDKTPTAERKNFMMICEWEECNAYFALSENASYLFHVQTHVHHAADLFYSGEVQRYTCKWRACAKPDSGITDEFEFARHCLYHPFHQKLKMRGLVVLNKLKIYVPCQLDSSYSHLVPDFPNSISCKWGECAFQCNCITSFDDHVKFHVLDQKFPPTSQKAKKQAVFYTCKWSGCAGYCVNDKSKLLEHTQTHTNMRQFACAGCGGLFCNRHKFLDHHRRQATIDSGFMLDNVVYQCTHCSKKFPTESILRNHMRSHVYNFLCQYCKNTFSTSSGLRKHIIYRHRKERQFGCQQCDYRAKDRYDLTKHVERAHQDKPLFSCMVEGCSYTCCNEHTYSVHLKMKHSTEAKNYLCHVCNKKFGEGRCLSRHLVRIHDYRRPSGVGKFRYSCDNDGNFRLQKVKYESKKLVAMKELQRRAESSLLAMGVSPQQDMDLVFTTDTGEEQQVKFVSYKNALKQLNNEESLHSDDEEEETTQSRDMTSLSHVTQSRDMTSLSHIALGDTAQCSSASNTETVQIKHDQVKASP